MPRKLAVIIPAAPERAARASRRAILDSPLWPQADAPGGPWDLTRRDFDQHRMLRHVQGDFSPSVALARALYVGQLRLAADLFYQGDRRIRAHWPDVLELREYLDGALERSIGVFSHRPVVITSPAGKALGSKRVADQQFASAQDFQERRAKAIIAVRKDLCDQYGEGPTETVEEICQELGCSRATYYKYLRGELPRRSRSRGKIRADRA